MAIVCTRALVADPNATPGDAHLRITDYLTAESGIVFQIHYHFTRESS